jgi:decaprenylphospho-beta-D-erythro-pentofuranosid-2-ulose 2-reductase
VSDNQPIWILGATSAIAHAYARRRAESGARLLLLGRNEMHLRANAADLLARGAKTASVRCCDLARPVDYDAMVADLMASDGPPAEVLIAYGILEQPDRSLSDVTYVRDLIETNFTSVACWLLTIIARWDRNRPLKLIVIGSVAGDRGRARNFVYGSAKGGLDRLLEGLQHAYAGTHLRIIRIKPGFVDTPMTANLTKSGPLWAKPDRIAADIERAVERGRALIYTPWFWRPIMMIIRHLPRFIFDRLDR